MESEKEFWKKPTPNDILTWGLKWERLMNKDYLIAELKTKPQYELARQIGCTPHTLRKALKYHGIITIPGRNIKK